MIKYIIIRLSLLLTVPILIISFCACGHKLEVSPLPPQNTSQKVTADMPEEAELWNYETYLQHIALMEQEDISEQGDMFQWITYTYPDLAENYEIVLGFCFQDLLRDTNKEIWFTSYEQKSDVSSQTKLKCKLIKCFAYRYESLDISAQDPIEWFKQFHVFSLRQFQSQGYEINQKYYEDNPIQKQHMTAVLCEPEWRLPSATPVIGGLKNEEVYVSAVNTFSDLLKYGIMDERIKVFPEGTDVANLCTEKTHWSIKQTDDNTVELCIIEDECREITISYTPS